MLPVLRDPGRPGEGGGEAEGGVEVIPPPRPQQSRANASTSGGDRDDGPVYWATGNYDPQRYYGETRGWSPEFRDYVRDAYGDLDTYEANHPD